MIGAQEQTDLDEMKSKVREAKLKAYDYMRELARMDEAGLRNCGYKSVADALTRQMESSQRDIRRIETEFLKKHPD